MASRWAVRAAGLVLLLSPGGAQGAAQPTGAQPGPALEALDRFTSPLLTRFESEAEFEAYIAALKAVAGETRSPAAVGGPLHLAPAQVTATDAGEPPCPPENPECAEPAGLGQVVVTGSRVAGPVASITNNQMRGVDEGDIVKQIGRFLIVLSDGRLFVIDTDADGRRGFALADRMNVYRDPEVDMWYDEMLVLEDRILVAGYGYDVGATELSVFRLGADGRLRRDGVFLLSSNDYYSSSNYATRIVGDSLVVYTPLDVLDSLDGGRISYPVIRRWVREDDSEKADRPGTPLYDARSIYRPVRLEHRPTIHSVSACPLGEVGAERDLACRTTAVLGPRHAEWYVTADEVILWAQSVEWDLDRCPAAFVPGAGDTIPAVLFRLPHDASAPGVAGARGVPFDQFSLQLNDGRLRALVDRWPERCSRDWSDPAEPMYIDLPLGAFRPRVEEVPPGVYTPVPSPGTQWIANRFTETHLVYGGLSRFRRGLPDLDSDEYFDPEWRERLRRQMARPPAFVVPAADPRSTIALDTGHTVIRAERYAERGIVLTGYRDRSGLSVSLIDLDGPPAIASTVELAGRFESEGRSHAFNSLSRPDGRGLIGLPTSPKVEDSDRVWWRSRASDLSFLQVGRGGVLGDLGRLDSDVTFDRSDDEDGLEGYECEVSCIDWYGNSRPIFTDGRIFALTGVELVEGRVVGNRIREIRRFDFARARPPR